MYRRIEHYSGDALPCKDRAVYEYTGPPLTRAALEDLLESLGVRPDTYSLYGAHNLPDAIVMDKRLFMWVVFYTERGEESLLRTHLAESAACLDLLERVTSWDHNFFEMVAGPAPPEAADAEFDAWLAERSLTREDLGPDEWKSQDSAWVRNEPDYRRYWVRTASIRRRL